eukprot:PhF_6_TR6199/c0_g1_i1/m.9321/K13711/PI4K2; phosphatidylinositol 4-kinase type 2
MSDSSSALDRELLTSNKDRPTATTVTKPSLSTSLPPVSLTRLSDGNTSAFLSSDGAIEQEGLIDEDAHTPRALGFGALQRDVLLVRRGVEEHDVRPELVSAGSSGSYFCRAVKDGPYKGIFKPRDEEPYGPHNPKLGKLIQRTLCPCFFGRMCLVLNQGYISEACASVVDHHLRLRIVPETIVTSFISPAFNYKQVASTLAKYSIRSLPRKVGSFQKFVHNYVPASSIPEATFFTLMDDDAFLDQFQRLTILDYIIRNTDRGLDNFLMNLTSPEGPRIAAIDNGLAFPHKHPDNVRMYPYGWIWLPQAQVPYTKKIAEEILPLISSVTWRSVLVSHLEGVMRQDSRFSASTFKNQMAVMRGQIANLTIALQDKLTPTQLVDMPPYSIVEEHGKEVSRVRAKLACCKCW